MRKHFYSILTFLVSFLLMTACSRQFQYGAFKIYNFVEPKSDSGNYLLKNDGTKVYGQAIVLRKDILLKDFISIDGKRFKINEIDGYRQNSWFYGRRGKDFILRIIRGKINVYTSINHFTNGVGHSDQTTATFYYAQRGDKAPLERFSTVNDLKNLVGDCSKSVGMLEISARELKNKIKSDRNYLNNVVNVYNNKCR